MRFAHVASAAFFVCVLAACTRPRSDVTELQISFWGSIEQQKIEYKIVEEFERTHPKIKITPLRIPLNRYAEKVQAMMVGDVAPDIMMVDIKQYQEWTVRGVLLDVTADVRAITHESELLPIPKKSFERDGHYFAIPVICHGLATYYNEDVLRQSNLAIPTDGLTWDFLESIGPQFSRKGGNREAPTDYAFVMPESLMPIFWQHGVEVFDDLRHPTRVTVNTPAAAEAIRLLRRMIVKKIAVPPDVVADQGRYQMFRDGKVAFFFSGRWSAPEFVGKTNFKWDVAAFPRGPKNGLTLHGGSALAVSSRSRHPDVAREYLRFYCSREGARIAMRGGRAAPVFRDLAFGQEFLALSPPRSMHHFSNTMEAGAAQAALYAPGMQEVFRIFSNHIDQRAMSELDVPPEKILRALEIELQRWLNESRALGRL